MTAFRATAFLAICFVSLAYSPRALATTYSEDFCFKYAVSFSDARADVGDDYLTSNASALDARGVYYTVVQVSPFDTIYFGYTPWEGDGQGCTGALSLDSTKSYNIFASSRAVVNDNLIKIYDDDTSPAYYGFGLSGHVPMSSGTVNVTSPVGSGWNVAAAATQALARRNAGLASQEVIFYTQQCGTWSGGTPSNGSCMRSSTGEVYIRPMGSGSPDSGQKYTIVHEMGHEIAWLKNGGDAATKDDSASLDSCLSPEGNTGHRMTTKEYQGQAVNEGIANYYAATAFNNTTETDCHFEYYKGVDLDGDGSQSDEDPTLTCEGGSYWYVSGGYAYPYIDGDWMVRDYVEESCEQLYPGGTLGNRSTELDWMRFFWDLDHDQGVATTKIFDIWDASNPESWNATGWGSSYTCGSTDWPSGRLQCAADTEGVLSEWTAESVVNGVSR